MPPPRTSRCASDHVSLCVMVPIVLLRPGPLPFPALTRGPGSPCDAWLENPAPPLSVSGVSSKRSNGTALFMWPPPGSSQRCQLETTSGCLVTGTEGSASFWTPGDRGGPKAAQTSSTGAPLCPFSYLFTLSHPGSHPEGYLPGSWVLGDLETQVTGGGFLPYLGNRKAFLWHNFVNSGVTFRWSSDPAAKVCLFSCFCHPPAQKGTRAHTRCTSRAAQSLQSPLPHPEHLPPSLPPCMGALLGRARAGPWLRESLQSQQPVDGGREGGKC